MSKTCSVCGAVVERQDCHRNRFAEYICKTCQSAGIKSTWRRRAKHITKKFTLRAGRWVGAALLVVVLIWMFVNFLTRMDS